MKLTTHQIKKIILKELNNVLNEQDDIASKLDGLYADENSRSQLRQILTSLTGDKEAEDWIDGKISQIQTEIDEWEKIVADLEKAGMDPDNYYADEAAEDAFHTFESEVWPRRKEKHRLEQEKNRLEQEKKMLTSHEIMEHKKSTTKRIRKIKC